MDRNEILHHFLLTPIRTSAASEVTAYEGYWKKKGIHTIQKHHQDHSPTQNSRAYMIPCLSGKVYMWQTISHIQTSILEHIGDISDRQ
jgi:hypothetical protein